MVANFEARRMSSTLTEDLEELDYMTEREREGMWEGGSEESFAKDYTFSCVMLKSHHFIFS